MQATQESRVELTGRSQIQEYNRYPGKGRQKGPGVRISKKRINRSLSDIGD
jgi:hypothetical protein